MEFSFLSQIPYLRKVLAYISSVHSLWQVCAFPLRYTSLSLTFVLGSLWVSCMEPSASSFVKSEADRHRMAFRRPQLLFGLCRGFGFCVPRLHESPGPPLAFVSVALILYTCWLDRPSRTSQIFKAGVSLFYLVQSHELCTHSHPTEVDHVGASEVAQWERRLPPSLTT